MATVDQTPFDNNPEVEKMVKLFNKQYIVIIQLLRNNPDQIQERIDELMDILLKHRQVQKLRDPIDYELFPIFLEFAGRNMERWVELRRSQLQLRYFLLQFHFELIVVFNFNNLHN